MPDAMDIAHMPDTEIVHLAYVERVKEAFKVFADAVSMGENEKLCKERFLRLLQQTRRIRDSAIDAIHGIDMVEPTAEIADPTKNRYGEKPAEPLSAEDQAMVDMAVGTTTGAKPLQPLRLPQRR
jgi:hypothetical protein